jgi:hypothetical protein
VIRDVSEGNESGHRPTGLAGGCRVGHPRGGLAWVAAPVVPGISPNATESAVGVDGRPNRTDADGLAIGSQW